MGLAQIGCAGEASAADSNSGGAVDQSVKGSDGSRQFLAHQQLLLDSALDHLRPAVSGKLNLYFVGVAGSAEQKVFAREIQSIGSQFERKFAGSGHVIELINSPRTSQTIPIATPDSLRATINRIAALIDRKRDILFLYLTSHGSRDHRLSFNLPGVPMTDLSAASLAEILDQSGIDNLVVVISACYSGGFIPQLQGDHRLIMTAAAADRTSFGCSDSSEFTYFGRAYFEEGLGLTNSFVAAFGVATNHVARRELAEGAIPSSPQMSIGRAIRPVLEDYRWQLTETKRVCQTADSGQPCQ